MAKSDFEIIGELFGGMLMIDASQVVEAVLQEQARKEYVRRIASGEPASDVYIDIRRRMEA